MKKIKKILLGVMLMGIGMNVSAAGTVENLSEREKNIVLISAFTANGDLEKLEDAVNSGLDAGLTINEIKDSMVQLYAYCGFPRSLNALTTLLNISKERAGKGIKDEIGKTATPLPKNTNIYELGTKVQTELVGAPVKGELYAFSPDSDRYLKAHLFGDIFSSDVLDYKTRELVTVAALSAMEGVNPQLQAHMVMSQNAGVTIEELQEIAPVLKENVGRKEARNYNKVLENVLNK